MQKTHWVRKWGKGYSWNLTVAVIVFATGLGKGVSPLGKADSDIDRAAIREQLKAVRNAAATPEAKVAAVVEWVREHPEVTRVEPVRVQIGTVRPRSEPSTPAGALRKEISQGLEETRAMAKNVEERVALVAEFKRLNAEAIDSLVPPKPTAEKLQLQRQAMVEQVRSRLVADPNNETLKMFFALQEIRAKARTPEEKIKQTVNLAESKKPPIKDNIESFDPIQKSK